MKSYTLNRIRGNRNRPSWTTKQVYSIDFLKTRRAQDNDMFAAENHYCELVRTGQIEDKPMFESIKVKVV